MTAPTEKQVALLKKRGKEIPETKEEASKLIDELLGGKKTEKKGDWKSEAPSDKQLNYLKMIGYTDEAPKTAGEASELINLQKQKNRINELRMVASKNLSTEEVKQVVDDIAEKFPKLILAYSVIAQNCLEIGINESFMHGMFSNQYQNQ